MKNSIVKYFCGFLLLCAGLCSGADRERLLLDYNWRFHLGDEWGLAERLNVAGCSQGPAAIGFGDQGWRRIDLPHDWAVELPFDPAADMAHGFKPIGPGYHSNDIGWYRRTFVLPASDQGKRLWIEFDGVFRDCRVFFNGYLVGHHESGYSSFRYDVTDLAKCGGTNSLAVRVDASEFEGWFYEGAGIYRHVWLVKTSPVSVAPDGIFVHGEFAHPIPSGPATVILETTLNNAHTNGEKARVTWQILDPAGKPAARAEKSILLPPLGQTGLVEKTRVNAPLLWSPESPNLYKLITTVSVQGEAVDQVTTEFGLRTTTFTPDGGFLLNGRHYEIKGTCNHQDHAGVGAALPNALQYFRARRLKEMGDNAVRTSHNAPTPEWLEACDHLGLLVMDENRLLGSDAANLELLRGQILRDRNHPSVFIWSLCNEETRQTTTTAGRCAQTMQNLVHSLDPTRLCTAAVSEGNEFEGINGVMDVRGWNYRIKPVDEYHASHPQQPNIGTEEASALGTRGIYHSDTNRGFMSAYDDNAPSWGNTSEAWWQVYAVRPWLSGGMVWTGFDYRGEPTPFHWPCISSQFGIMDTCGFAKDNFYYYQSWWSERPVLHLLPHWTWPGHDGEDMDVRCFSNCEEVELLLNGRSLGVKPMPKNGHLQWTVKYTPGTLQARGYKNGALLAEDSVTTTGAPAAIRLSCDRRSLETGREDAAVVTAFVIDGKGQICPTAGQEIHFTLDGPGRILGVGNGDPTSHEPDTVVSQITNRTLALTQWRMKPVRKRSDYREVAENFDDSQWQAASVDGPSPATNEAAIFRTIYQASAEDLNHRSVLLAVGQIESEARIYVNGQLAGDTKDTMALSHFELKPYLHPGTNSIALAVMNRRAPAAIKSGVALWLQDETPVPPWQRRVFNGRAQILLQAGRDSGTLHLTATADGLKSAEASVYIAGDSSLPAVP